MCARGYQPLLLLHRFRGQGGAECRTDSANGQEVFLPHDTEREVCRPVRKLFTGDQSK